MRVGGLALLVFGVLALAGPEVHAQESAGKERPTETPAVAAYVIAAGDLLEIMVWKDPDLTRDVTVRVDGMITVPLLGELQAAGRTPTQLAESLAKGLERYIEAPQVAVAVSNATSARFYVVGNVAKSGVFQMIGSTTVLQGLALAGGFREFAKLDKIIVIQRDGTVIGVNYKRIADGKDFRQNIVLSPGDTVVVP